MFSKTVAVLVLLVCYSLQYAASTGILLNALKSSVQNTRCKLHYIGSKIIQHSHHDDPCAEQETHVTNGDHHMHGPDEFGSQNVYQVTENSAEDRPSYFGSHHDYHKNHQGHGTRLECLRHSSCPSDKACINNKCLDPCESICNSNSKCQTRDHLTYCTCNAGYIGDPYIRCYPNKQSSDNEQQELGVKPSTNSYQASNGKNDYFKGVTEENTSYTDQSEVTSEIYPSTLDIDVRSGLSRQSDQQKIVKKTYVTVPSEGGRNLFKVKCPNGGTPTIDGECLEEF